MQSLCAFVPEDIIIVSGNRGRVLKARSESVGFAEIVNKDRMVGTKAQWHKGTE